MRLLSIYLYFLSLSSIAISSAHADDGLVFETKSAHKFSKQIKHSHATSLRYKKFTKKHNPLFQRIRSQLKVWNDLDIEMKQFGIDEAGFYTHLANDEKLAVLGREFGRYFIRQTRAPLKVQLKQWERGLQRNYEMESSLELTETDQAFEYNLFSYNNAISRTRKTEIKKEKKLKRSDIKKRNFLNSIRLKVGVNVTRGVLATQLRTSHVNLGSYVGVNKELEFYAYRDFKKLKFKVHLGMNLQEDRAYIQLEKKLFKNKIRLNFSTEENFAKNTDFIDNALFSMNYVLRF